MDNCNCSTKLDAERAWSVLFDRCKQEQSWLMICAIGEALAEQKEGKLIDALGATDQQARVAACRIAANCYPTKALLDQLHQMLLEEKEPVVGEALQALQWLHTTTRAEELLGALQDQTGQAPPWILLDALLGIAYPGIPGCRWPRWAQKAKAALSYPLQGYFKKHLDKQQKEFQKRINKKIGSA